TKLTGIGPGHSNILPACSASKRSEMSQIRAAAPQLAAPVEPLLRTADALELRSDAARNRERILRAAREAFSTDGIDVPMATIARRAGVGTATLYRRFATREALITEVFTDQATACSSIVDDAFDDPDPWHAFATAIGRIVEMQLADRGFTSAFLRAFPDAVDLEGRRRRALTGFASLVRRAQEAGALRQDFDPNDLWLVLVASNAVIAESPRSAAVASRRLVRYLLDAFRAEAEGRDRQGR
ncbi:TetR/AcrR family transcriptional regulator, partial [Cellulosimicrobium cellulans]|uniref:TetR/AcrR family transcriptional regulator n=1 Tax=Cellulosimicrobium cellulans TaxID=1710 RepID=UPI0038094F1E